MHVRLVPGETAGCEELWWRLMCLSSIVCCRDAAVIVVGRRTRTLP